jgi:hypothetical protein
VIKLTKNQINTIKKSILDAVMTYCDIKIANAQYAFTEIGVVTDTDYIHYTNTVNIKGAIYTGVLSVGKIVYPKDSVVYCFVPNNQYNNMFILGKLDASPANIEGGEIHIGETGKQNDDGSMKYYFNVDDNGNVEITQGSINLGLNNDGTYNFSVDNDGNMIARDGYFTGDIVGSSIKSSDGTFEIDENGNIIGADIVGSSFSSTNGTFEIDKDGNITGADISGSTLSGDTISGGSIEIGNESGDYYFGVDTNGEVTIVGANISGYATDGEVASEISVLPHTISLSTGDGSGGITITMYDENGNSVSSDTSTMYLWATNIKFDADHRLELNAGEFVFSGGNFSLDASGNATFTGTVNSSALALGEIEVAQAYVSQTSGRTSCFFPRGAAFGGGYDDPDISISSDGNGIITSHLVITNGSSGITSGRFYLGDIGTSNYHIGSEGAGAFKSLSTDDGTVSKSDKKEKTHIKYLSEDNKIKDFIMSLQPVEYKWKDNGERTHLGFYAQDVQQESLSTIGDTGLYCAAHYEKDDNGEPIDIGYTSDTPDEELSWGLRYTEFIAPMVSMIQMQQKQIDELQSQIQQLQERNEK